MISLQLSKTNINYINIKSPYHAILETLDMERAAATEVRGFLPSCQTVGPKNFELTGRSASATLYLMLSPGGKCCLIFQSCKKAQVSPQYPDYSLKIQERCKYRQHYIRCYCPVLCIREIYKYTD